MAKTVDHQLRRRQLADAALRVVQSRGLDDLTIRGVAAEAGWSTGAIAHYFNNKDTLLEAAHERVVERVFERVREPKSSRSPLEQLREMLLSVLPLDDERRAELRVWFAFVGRALARSDFAEQHRARRQFWIAEIEQHIVAAQDAGEVPADTDTRRAALDLALLADGISMQSLLLGLDGMPPSEQTALVDRELTALAAS